MFLAAAKTTSRRLLGLVIIGSIALVGCGSTSETAEPSRPPTPAVTPAASGLPVDAAAFAVTGEESDPPVVEFSNGTKTLTYLPMIHIAKQDFYDGVTEAVRAEKEDGATLSDADKRKARRMVGFLPTPEQYAELAGSGYVGQSNDDYLGLVNDKDVNVDATPEELIKAYEDKYGEIEVTGEDATSDLSEPAASLLPPEQVESVVLDARNKVVAEAIAKGPDKIILVFGAAHGPGIIAELQQLDPAWQRTK